MPRAFFVLRERDFLANLRGELAIKSLPDGTEFMFAEYSAIRRGWLCVVEHESFEETADGGELPELNVEFATAVIGWLGSTTTHEASESFTVEEMERRLSAIAGAKDWSELERAVGGTAELTTIIANAEAHKGITSAEMATRARRLIERCADVKPGQIVAGGIALGGVCRSSPDSFVFTERKPTLAEFEAATDNLTCGESLGVSVNRETWRDRQPLL